MRVKNKKKEEDLRIAFFSIVLRVKTGKNREEIREMRNKKRGNPRFRGSLSCLFKRISKTLQNLSISYSLGNDLPLLGHENISSMRFL